MTEGSPLWDGGHLNASQWNADDGTEDERNRDQAIINDAVMQQGTADRQQHSRFARPDAVASGGR